MYRTDTHHQEQRVAESDELQLVGQESLQQCGGEQHILREEIMDLSRENEREMSCAFGGKRGEETRRRVTRGASYSVDVDIRDRHDTALQQRDESGDVRHPPDEQKTETRGGNHTGFEARQPRPYGSTPPRVDVSSADIRRVDLIGRSVTSMSLANAVETTTGEPGTANNSEAPLLWTLVVRQCQLSSLIPVAGLLHHLDGLMGLRIHEVDGLALAGVERVLADAPCLSTLTICKCGLTYLPRLQSGSIEVLDLSDNQLASASGLEMLFRLKELILAGNHISTLTDLRPLISLGAGCLREFSLDRNPVTTIPRYQYGRTQVLGHTNSAKKA